MVDVRRNVLKSRSVYVSEHCKKKKCYSHTLKEFNSINVSIYCLHNSEKWFVCP